MVSSRTGASRQFLLAAVACLTAASEVAPAAAQPSLVWGGRMPEPGQGYVPSAPRADGAPDGPVQLPPADIPQTDAPGTAEPQGGVEPYQAGEPAAGLVETAPDLPDSELPGEDAARSDEASERSLYEDLMGLSQTAPNAAPEAAEPEPEARLDEPAPRSEPYVVGRVPPPQGEIRRASRPRGEAPGRETASLGRPEPFAMPGAGVPGRGALEDEAPTGYAALPREEMACRRQLSQMGVRFTELAPIAKSRSCAIPHPIRVTQIAKGVAMKPAATLNCAAAARISGWVESEVKPAARWRLWKSPAAVLNASSYRCSLIAGSRTVSEHASGNALDVRGFVWSDGSVFDVEKKGFFSFREKGFQKTIRHSACEYFGTVLGPGYNYAHRDHLHLDAKNRRRMVCK